MVPRTETANEYDQEMPIPQTNQPMTPRGRDRMLPATQQQVYN